MMYFVSPKLCSPPLWVLTKGCSAMLGKSTTLSSWNEFDVSKLKDFPGFLFKGYRSKSALRVCNNIPIYISPYVNSSLYIHKSLKYLNTHWNRHFKNNPCVFVGNQQQIVCASAPAQVDFAFSCLWWSIGRLAIAGRTIMPDNGKSPGDRRWSSGDQATTWPEFTKSYFLNISQYINISITQFLNIATQVIK